ncbi:unnamed protein product [Diatraea saccharalis]|uniref:Uncharacterized protein n=1 Tax=Diatraea saccharalis TaxID=40085 RepID=A0A9N9QYY2_9NEOP|nr:unnamed protein product [Diatraea saccharalis]
MNSKLTAKSVSYDERSDNSRVNVLVSNSERPGRRRQAPRQRCRSAGARGGGAGAGSTGDSDPAPEGLSRSSAEGGRYTCVHAPAVTGHPPASISSGSGDQQLSDSQHPTTTVTKPISRASTMYTSAFPGIPFYKYSQYLE